MNRNTVSTCRSSALNFQPPPRYQVQTFHPGQAYPGQSFVQPQVHPYHQRPVYETGVQPGIGPHYVQHPRKSFGKYRPQGPTQFNQAIPAPRMQNAPGPGPQSNVMYGSMPVIPQGMNGQVARPQSYASFQHQQTHVAPQHQPHHPISQGPAFGPNGYHQQHALYGPMPANAPSNGSGFIPNPGQGSFNYGLPPNGASSSLIASIESALLSYFLQSSNHPQPAVVPTPAAVPTHPEPASPSTQLKIHPILGTTYLPLRWDLTQDPSTGVYYGRHVIYEEYHEPAFCIEQLETAETEESETEIEQPPGLKQIAVVVPIEINERKGFATMEPDEQQRLYAFVVSAVPSQTESRWDEIISASSMKGVNRTSQIESESQPEKYSCQTLPGNTKKGEKEQNQEEAILSHLELDVLSVLDGIRCGLRELLPRSLWSSLSLREKYTLAKRLSARRLKIANSNLYLEIPPGYLLKTVCNEEFIRSAIEVGDTLPLLQKDGRLEGFEEACAVIWEAHRVLDAYVSDSRSSSSSAPSSASFLSSSSPIYAEKDPLRVIDLLGDKTTFKGLRLMADGSIPGLKMHAFFLCVA